MHVLMSILYLTQAETYVVVLGRNFKTFDTLLDISFDINEKIERTIEFPQVFTNAELLAMSGGDIYKTPTR